MLVQILHDVLIPVASPQCFQCFQTYFKMFSSYLSEHTLRRQHTRDLGQVGGGGATLSKEFRGHRLCRSYT